MFKRTFAVAVDYLKSETKKTHGFTVPYDRKPTALSVAIDSWSKRVEEEAMEQHRRVKELDKEDES